MITSTSLTSPTSMTSLPTSVHSNSSAAQTSFSSSATPTPVALARPACNSMVNYFMSLNDMNTTISKFCSEAALQHVQDKESGSIDRTYNQNSSLGVDIFMEWPSGIDITQNMEVNCINSMTQIMDACDVEDPGNPLNGKHGGALQVNPVTYKITPKSDRQYTPGTCTPISLKDGGAKETSGFRFDNGSTNGSREWLGVGDSYQFNYTALPNPIIITPVAGSSSSNYIQFEFGAQL
ncbi:hypothetical protein EAF04_001974 [Stromatinia cepivora]|nr:hypothetical protein EAF04_001974 [Stromatinia cepivora]